MHATILHTRYARGTFQGEECLLIYDEQELTGTMLGEDIRVLFDTRPGIARIYLLAPYVPYEEFLERLHSSAVFARMNSYFKAIGGRLCVLSLQIVDGKLIAHERPYYVDDDGSVKTEAVVPVPDELRNGWLFDLFDKHRGRVDAPLGIHFSKSSGRHSSKFLRTSNVLVSSTACAGLAFFALGASGCEQPRHIFVDTAPLISVAQAAQRIAIAQGVWTMNSPIHSFSSYGGLDSLPPASGREWVLISASTSGGLVSRLIEREFNAGFIATLFYLGERPEGNAAGSVVCDLTFRQGRSFGYPMIEGFTGDNCPLCDKGYFLAELEGDQFQLERRANKYLAIKTVTQTKDARDFLEEISRCQAIRIRPFQLRGNSSDFSFDVERLLAVDAIRHRLIRAIRRFLPLPLSYVVLVDIRQEEFNMIMREAGLDSVLANAKVISQEELPNVDAIPEGVGCALVLFGVLHNFAAARSINAQLRIKVPKGCVAYTSVLTVANSAEHLADLKMFLTYGENGRDTHSYDAARSIMLPAATVGETAWESELAMLQRLREDDIGISEIEDRINELLSSEARTDGLFWPGKAESLGIKNDFVYLKVDAQTRPISQADVIATVANLLACARMDNRGLQAPILAGKEPIKWHQSVYGHVILSPGAFEDYNDAILHASFLRCASPSELNYSSDEASSERVLHVILAALQSWDTGGGDSLPEFLIALALRRLSLYPEHHDQLRREAQGTELPAHLAALLAEG